MEKRYKEAMADLSQEEQRSYTQVTRKLTEKLNTPEILSIKVTGYQQFKQQPGESMDTFAIRLEDQFEEAYPNITGVDRERMLIDGFIKGISKTMQALVSCSNPSTLSAAVTAARKLEFLPGQRNLSNNMTSMLFGNTAGKQPIAVILGPMALTEEAQQILTKQQDL